LYDHIHDYKQSSEKTNHHAIRQSQKVQEKMKHHGRGCHGEERGQFFVSGYFFSAEERVNTIRTGFVFDMVCMKRNQKLAERERDFTELCVCVCGRKDPVKVQNCLHRENERPHEVSPLPHHHEPHIKSPSRDVPTPPTKRHHIMRDEGAT
jgi:hypothetical protein